MKLLYFDDYKLGVLKGDRVVDVSSAVRDIPHTGPGDLINGLIARFDQYKGKLEDAASSGQGVPLSSVRGARSVDDMWQELRGMRAPGTGVPGTLAVGTWRGGFGKDFAVVHGHGPGLVVEVAGEGDDGRAGMAAVHRLRTDGRGSSSCCRLPPSALRIRSARTHSSGPPREPCNRAGRPHC